MKDTQVPKEREVSEPWGAASKDYGLSVLLDTVELGLERQANTRERLQLSVSLYGLVSDSATVRSSPSHTLPTLLLWTPTGWSVPVLPQGIIGCLNPDLTIASKLAVMMQEKSVTVPWVPTKLRKKLQVLTPPILADCRSMIREWEKAGNQRAKDSGTQGRKTAEGKSNNSGMPVRTLNRSDFFQYQDSLCCQGNQCSESLPG